MREVPGKSLRNFRSSGKVSSKTKGPGEKGAPRNHPEISSPTLADFECRFPYDSYGKNIAPVRRRITAPYSPGPFGLLMRKSGNSGDFPQALGKTRKKCLQKMLPPSPIGHCRAASWPSHRASGSVQNHNLEGVRGSPTPTQRLAEIVSKHYSRELQRGAKKRGGQNLTRRPRREQFPTPLTSVRFAPPPHIPFLLVSPLEMPRISLS